MYSFDDLLSQNLPVCVKVQNVADFNTSWSQQIALFVLTTITCLSGITALSYYTFKWGLHTLPPLGLDVDPRIMIFNVLIFLVSIICLGLWLQDEKKIDIKASPEETEALNYILPVSHSLHIGEQAWDLSAANSIVIDYPHRAIVHFKNPDRTFVLLDEQSGYPLNVKDQKTLKNLAKNSALFVYLSGVELPNRYMYQTNWWWNAIAGSLFVFSTMLPFLFQALGFQLYWIGFLAIPLSYLTFKVGQREFQDHRVFSFSRFLAANHNTIDTKIYRAPHL